MNRWILIKTTKLSVTCSRGRIFRLHHCHLPRFDFLRCRLSPISINEQSSQSRDGITECDTWSIITVCDISGTDRNTLRFTREGRCWAHNNIAIRIYGVTFTNRRLRWLRWWTCIWHIFTNSRESDAGRGEYLRGGNPCGLFLDRGGRQCSCCGNFCCRTWKSFGEYFKTLFNMDFKILSVREIINVLLMQKSERMTRATNNRTGIRVEPPSQSRTQLILSMSHPARTHELLIPMLMQLHHLVELV